MNIHAEKRRRDLKKDPAEKAKEVIVYIVYKTYYRKFGKVLLKKLKMKIIETMMMIVVMKITKFE